MSKMKNLTIAEVEALSDFSDQISEVLNSMEEYRVHLDKTERRSLDKTYKGLVNLWENIQNKLIYFWNTDERDDD